MDTPIEKLDENWRGLLDFLHVCHGMKLKTEPPKNWQGDGFYITAEDCDSTEPDNVERIAQVGCALWEKGFFTDWDISGAPLYVNLEKTRLFLSDFESTGRWAVGR